MPPRILRSLPKPSSPPRVTVVVPCYNYGHYLPACLESVLGQPGVDVDVLVVDDASPDGSGAVADALAASDPRVRVVHHATNKGHIATYNDGLEAAEGEYVVLLSADDLLVDGALGRATTLLAAERGVGLVYGHPVTLDGDARPAARTAATGWTVWRGADWIATRCRRGFNGIMSPEVVMRTEVLRQVGLYRADLPHSGDMEMWLRAASVADVGRVNGADQAYYRVHQASMQRTRFSTVAADLRGRHEAFEAAFTGAAASLPDAAGLRAQARTAVARTALRAASRGLDEGTATREEVAELVELAESIDPDIRTSRLGHALRRRLADRPVRPTGAIGSTARRVGRRIEESARWHWWRRTGT